MATSGPLIRDISDTARWVAAYRALESERPDAHFRDPYARRLAGPDGERIANSLKIMSRDAWAFVARTVAFDELIGRALREGCDAVLNLAAGLDARPYRMDLDPELCWIEVDLPELLRYKEEVLAGKRPRCRLERVALDLSDQGARRELLERAAPSGRRVVVITEGLLVYLGTDEVAALARDLAAAPGVHRWVLDVGSPALIRMLNRRVGRALAEAQAPLRFGPAEGIDFFRPHGWRPLEVRSSLKEGARLRRLAWWMKPFAWLPEPKQPGERAIWSGLALLEKG